MATLRQLAASLSESEKGLFSEFPYTNRDQEIAGITRDMKKFGCLYTTAYDRQFVALLERRTMLRKVAKKNIQV